MTKIWPPLRHHIQLPWVYGAQTVELTPAQAARYATDPAGAIAEALNCSIEDYLTWLEWPGRLQCDGVTARGKRCRAIVPDLMLREPRELAGAAGYCAVHGNGYGMRT